MVQAHQPTRVERRKQKTRLALLEVALDLFHRQGIYGTSIEDITDSADIGKGTFYQYFPTKESLLCILLDEGLQNILDRIYHDVHRSSSANVLRTATNAELEFYLDNPKYLSLCHQIQGLLRLEHRTATELWKVYDRYFDRVGSILGSSCSPPLHPEQARDLAVTLSAFTSGLLTFRFLFSRTDEPARDRHNILARIERSIEALV